MDIAYYPGCSLKQSSALYDLQTKKVLSKLDINLMEIQDWNCCGATSASKTDDFLSIAMPARNIGIAESAGFSQIVIPCSACYSKTLVAQEKLHNDPGLKNEINAGFEKKIKGDLKISTILEVLLTSIESGALSNKITKKYQGLKPVCYYGCMMTRFPYKVPSPDNVENPQGMEKILKKIGLHPVDWNFKTACCGASASMNDAKTSFTLMAKIMKDAITRGANCFVVTCPMCQMNLDAYQDDFCRQNSITERLPVFFITELLGLALGMTAENLQIDRHFVESTSILNLQDKVVKERDTK
jgi:heterodisulfide reductase subunit B